MKETFYKYILKIRAFWILRLFSQSSLSNKYSAVAVTCPCRVPCDFAALDTVCFPTSWIWVDLVTCIGQQNVADVTMSVSRRGPKEALPVPAFSAYHHKPAQSSLLEG